MANNKFIYIAFLIYISFASQCKGQVQIMSQLNEMRIVNNLSDQIGIITDNFQISSPSQSSYSFDQPMYSRQDDSFFQGQRYILSQSTVEIDNDTSYQLLVMRNFILRSPYYHFLSLIQITKSTSIITEISSINLTQSLKQSSSFEAILFLKNKGIILYSIDKERYVSLISLDNNNQLQLSTGVKISNQSININCAYDPLQQLAYFMVQDSVTNQLQLRTINFEGQVSEVLSEVIVCSYIKNPLIIEITSLQSFFLVQCNDQNIYNYSLYYIDTNINQIMNLQSENSLIPKYNIFAVDIINNVVIIVSQANDYSETIRVTQLTINKSKQILTQSYHDFNVGINNDFVAYIQGDLITSILYDLNMIVGISISQQKKIFQIQIPTIEGFKQINIRKIGDIYAFQYQGISRQDMSKITYVLVQTKIPTLKFSQDSDKEQIYNLSYANDALKRIFTIKATLITEDSTAIIITNPSANFQQIISSPSSKVIMKIEKYFIGYVSSGSISNAFQKPTFNSLEQSVVLQYPNQIDNIFSTFSANYILKSQNNENNEFTLTFIPAKSSITYGKIILNKPLLAVDEQSGFFLNTDKDGVKQINVLFFEKSGDTSYSFKTVNPACDDPSLLLFSGDILNNQVVVLCDKSLTLYRFSYNSDFVVQSSVISYPSDQIVGTIAKIELQPSGLLYITDNQKIIAININLNALVGYVNIPPNPQGQLAGRIIFFTESFVVTRNENNSLIIQQYSYNQFDGTSATLIRTFLNFGFQWTGMGIQVIKDFNINSNQEFLIVDAKTVENKVKKLFYRVSGNIQAQNQLLTTLEIEKTALFFALPQVVGYYLNQQLIFMDLFYELTLLVQLNLTPSMFLTQISNSITGQLTMNDKYQLNLNLVCYRSVQTAESYLMFQNENVVNFQNYFKKNEIKTPLSKKFDDKQFTNGHLFGWGKKFYDQSFTFEMSITQRLVNQEVQNILLGNNLNQLLVMPNALIKAKPQGIFLEEQLLINQNTGDCYFYKDGIVEIITKQDKTLVNQVVYSITSSKNSIFFTKYTIQGEYDSYPNSKPTFPQITTKQYETQRQNHNTFITIQSDATLGILALQKLQNNSLYQICLIQLPEDTTEDIFNFDCNVYSSISNLQIANIIYIESARKNIFITQFNEIYYDFSDDLSEYQVIDYRNFLIMKGLQFSNQQVYTSQKISGSAILISFLNSNIFKITLGYNQRQINIIDPVQTFYRQDQSQQIGNAFMNEQNQLFLLLQNTNHPANYNIVMYEQYFSSKNDYLIRSSFPITYLDSPKQIMISNYGENLIFSLSCQKDEQYAVLYTFDIQDQPQINILELKYTDQNIKNTTLTFKFSIIPIDQVNNILLLETPVLAGNDKPNPPTPSSTFALILGYQFLLILILYLI